MRRRTFHLSAILVAMVFPVLGQEPSNSQPGLVQDDSDAPVTSNASSLFVDQPLIMWLEHHSQPLRRLDLEIVPAASCASTACHGGSRPGIGKESAVRGAEYPLWLENDPHAQSWRTMCSPASIDILERLSILQNGTVLDQAAFDNCLKCHNTTRGYPTQQGATQTGKADILNGHSDWAEEFHAEGVGCASCHGPSANWLQNHYRTSWNDFESSTLGLVPNKNLLARARACAACHVGDSDRDMNHDMIAAGHPALHYEFTTYHNELPKHWRESERSGSVDFEAQLWVAGQIAALDASLALLESRAAKRLSVSTWPEFAASDCSTCHQSLRLDSEDYSPVSKPTTAGVSSWNRFGVEQILKLHETTPNGGSCYNNSVDQSLSVALRQLSSIADGQATLNARATQTAARNARIALDRWLQQQPVEQFSAEQLTDLAAASLRNSASQNRWEFVTQSYLAAIAARKGWPGGQSSQTLAEARRLRQALLFKPDSNTPNSLDEPGRKTGEFALDLADLLDRSQRAFQSLP